MHFRTRKVNGATCTVILSICFIAVFTVLISQHLTTAIIITRLLIFFVSTEPTWRTQQSLHTSGFSRIHSTWQWRRTKDWGGLGCRPICFCWNHGFSEWEAGSAVVMMQSQDGGTEGTGPTSVSAQQTAQFWGKGPVELALLGNGHCARQVSLLPYWHWVNNHTHTHTKSKGIKGKA